MADETMVAQAENTEDKPEPLAQVCIYSFEMYLENLKCQTCGNLFEHERMIRSPKPISPQKAYKLGEYPMIMNCEDCQTIIRNYHAQHNVPM